MLKGTDRLFNKTPNEDDIVHNKELREKYIYNNAAGIAALELTNRFKHHINLADLVLDTLKDTVDGDDVLDEESLVHIRKVLDDLLGVNFDDFGSNYAESMNVVIGPIDVFELNTRRRKYVGSMNSLAQYSKRDDANIYEFKKQLNEAIEATNAIDTYIDEVLQERLAPTPIAVKFYYGRCWLLMGAIITASMCMGGANIFYTAGYIGRVISGSINYSVLPCVLATMICGTAIGGMISTYKLLPRSPKGKSFQDRNEKLFKMTNPSYIEEMNHSMMRLMLYQMTALAASLFLSATI